MAAKESETAVDNALNTLLEQGVAIDKKQVEGLMSPGKLSFTIADIDIPVIDLTYYDQLLQGGYYAE